MVFAPPTWSCLNLYPNFKWSGTNLVAFSLMRISYLLFFLLISVLCTNAQLTFSEVLFDPATDENHDEYIEIYNLSQTDSADLSGYRFSDGQGVDQILPLGTEGKIPPGGFALLLDGSYPGSSTTYDSLFSGDVCIYFISDRAFGSNGLSNTQDECLLLIDAAGDTISAYCYSTDNESGFSDEKIVLQGPNTQENWKNGLMKGGTPGRRNSVSPFELDIGFQEAGVLLPPVIMSGRANHITVPVENYGLKMVQEQARLKISLDDQPEAIFDTAFSPPTARISLEIFLELTDILPGEYTLYFYLSWPVDQNPVNNAIRQVISIYQIENSLVVNEVKFLTGEEEPEWIELYNFGQEPVYLKGWAVADLKDTISIDTAIYLAPDSYLVLSGGPLAGYLMVDEELVYIRRDLPVFNNESDEIVLIRPDGAWHERVQYSDSWLQNEAVFKPSLERIHPSLYAGNARSWGPCVADAKATPGKINSIFAAPSVYAAELTAHPNPFSPDGDGREDVTLISGRIQDLNARLQVKIFDIRGRLIRTILENRFTGNRFDVVWDGLDDEGREARIGIYIIYVQVIDDLAGVLREMKSTVVLAKPL